MSLQPLKKSRREAIRSLSALVASVAVAGGFGSTCLSAQQKPAELRISAAAGLAPVMPAIAFLYQKETGIKLVVSVGSSEEMVAKITKGEPEDVFLGADFIYPEKLVAAGLTDAKAPVAFAKNNLVLFALKNSPFQPLNLESLQDKRLEKLAVGDLLRSPTGRASLAALTNLRLITQLKPKFVVSDSALKVAQSVEGGEAQLGLLPITIASSPHFKQVGTFIRIPQSQYPEMRQYAVILKQGDLPAAHQFMTWLLSDQIQGQLPNVGLAPLR